MEGDHFSEPQNASTEAHSEPQPPPVTASPPEVFQPLDRRVIRLWRINTSITFAVLFVIASGAVTIVTLALSNLGFLLPYMIGILLVLIIFYVVWYPARAYRAWGYRMDGKVIEARRGVIFHSRHLLPLNRLQHVDIHRGPIERAHGLSSLLLHTAGSQAATLVIPGLDEKEAQRLRDYLVEIGGDDAV